MRPLFLLTASLFLVGCTNPLTSLTQKATDKAIENKIEAETGAKVDVNSGNNQVTIQTDEGTMQYGSGDDIAPPPDFPTELIIGASSKVFISSTNPNGSSVAYSTTDAQATVLAQFITNLTASGWTKQMEINVDKAKMVNFQKGNQVVSVTISTNDNEDQPGQTVVNLVLTSTTD